MFTLSLSWRCRLIEDEYSWMWPCLSIILIVLGQQVLMQHWPSVRRDLQETVASTDHQGSGMVHCVMHLDVITLNTRKPWRYRTGDARLITTKSCWPAEEHWSFHMDWAMKAYSRSCVLTAMNMLKGGTFAYRYKKKKQLMFMKSHIIHFVRLRSAIATWSGTL